MDVVSEMDSAVRCRSMEPDGLKKLIAVHSYEPHLKHIAIHWLDINNIDDLERAGAFTARDRDSS